MKPAVPDSHPWLFGRTTDLVFGCGLLYVLFFPVLLALPESTTLIPFTIVIMLIAGPHYGATYLRIFETKASRSQYGRIFVFITLFVGAVFVLGLTNFKVGSALVVLYMTWSPWHVSGQNYGISLMLLRRRGVLVTPLAKRLLYTAFWLSFAPAVLVLHSGADVQYVPVQTSVFEVYPIFTLGIPWSVVRILIPAIAVAYVLCLAAVGFLLIRSARLSAIVPSIIIVVLQSMWYVLPGFLFVSGFDIYSSLAMTAIVLSAVHSIQYLWVSSYYRKRENPTEHLLPYLARSTLAGAAGLGVMLIFFSPDLLGTIPYDSGLALLAASALNVHHFAIDGVIWKLRDGAVARALLGDVSGEAPPDPTSGQPIWIRGMRPLVYGLGVASLLASAVFVWETEALDGADTDRYTLATERLRWIGRDSAYTRTQFAVMLVNDGKHGRALEEIDRSLVLLPNSETWMVKGQLHRKDRYWSAAFEAFDSAVQLDPQSIRAHASRKEAKQNMESRY